MNKLNIRWNIAVGIVNEVWSEEKNSEWCIESPKDGKEPEKNITERWANFNVTVVPEREERIFGV